MLSQRVRRCPNIKPALVQNVVFAGHYLRVHYIKWSYDVKTMDGMIE